MFDGYFRSRETERRTSKLELDGGIEINKIGRDG